MKTVKFHILYPILFFACIACNTQDDVKTSTDPVPPTEGLKTKNVIIVVIDGPRCSETWGEQTRQYIPKQANEMLQHVVFFPNFRNGGPTYTTSGHTAIMTGNYQNIDNSGSELPNYPSMMQYWREKYNVDSTKAWVIASKDKLEVLADCKHPEWLGRHKPSTNCGINGLGTGYRPDITTYQRTLELLSEHHPRLALINFREPDYSAHANDWDGYINGISNTDEYVYRLWNFIKSDSFYKGNTALFITNDHGRHLDGISNGYISHGDGCGGCRHITLYAYGPDFKKDHTVDTECEQIDISATIAKLLDFEMPTAQGRVLDELFAQ
ncbi:MAG: alkaline phosphatase family protein [Flavobacteriaceae bacterium]